MNQLFVLLLFVVTFSFVNPLTPTVVIWLQLSSILYVPDRVKPSRVIFDIRAI